MRWLLFLAFVANSYAVTLADLQDTWKQLQAQRENPPGWRGESPVLTRFKQQLRAWAESRLTAPLASPQQTAGRLLKELEDAGLTCKGAGCANSDGPPDIGAAPGIALDFPGGRENWLLMTTSVGISCGHDESVYLYERDGAEWKLRLSSEQNGYGQGKYFPQENVRVKMSDPDAQGRRLVFTAGTNPQCMSVWGYAYYRLYRLGAGVETLLDIGHGINVGEEYGGERLERDGVLLEIPSWPVPFDAAYTRPHILHYRIEGDKTRRVEPVALRPEDFVDEWLIRPWAEIAPWSDRGLVGIHAELHKRWEKTRFGDIDSSVACRSRPGVRQIAFHWKGENQPEYFLVQERAQFSYRMRDVSEKRQPGCPGEQAPDFRQRPTLFPGK